MSEVLSNTNWICHKSQGPADQKTRALIVHAKLKKIQVSDGYLRRVAAFKQWGFAQEKVFDQIQMVGTALASMIGQILYLSQKGMLT